MGLNKVIDFSIAKLLKDKGFEYQYQWNPNTDNLPTISEVVMWLYEKHGIWIYVSFANKNQWYFNCNKFGVDGLEKRLFHSNYNYSSPIEAYSEAIGYTLNNLIK